MDEIKNVYNIIKTGKKAYKTARKIKKTFDKVKQFTKDYTNHDFNLNTVHGLANDTFKQMLTDTYEANKNKIGDYNLDSELSGKRARVYKDTNSNKVVVAHRGTQGIHDVLTDIGLALTGTHSKRVEYAKQIQDKVNAKYGAENITTIGHSLGGYLAETVADKKSNVITYNKAAVIKDIYKRLPSNQTDIRTKGDIVSLLSKTQKGSKKVEIEDNSGGDILKAHNIDHLEKLNNQN